MVNVDGGSSGIGKVDDFLGAHVPPRLELGGEDDSPTQLHVKLSGEFLASFIVDCHPHFC